MKVLDFYCGAGGLASGFKKAGFEVLGVDISTCLPFESYRQLLKSIKKEGRLLEISPIGTKLPPRPHFISKEKRRVFAGDISIGLPFESYRRRHATIRG
jgi:hypothetical protein